MLSMIVALEQARSSSQIERLARSLKGWVERVGAQELLDSFTEWISQVLVQRLDSKGRKLELRIRNEQEGQMTTLIERARQWGEELNQEWLAKGLEQGREEGREEARRENADTALELVEQQLGAETVERLETLLDSSYDRATIKIVMEALLGSETADDFLSRVREAAQA